MLRDLMGDWYADFRRKGLWKNQSFAASTQKRREKVREQ